MNQILVLQQLNGLKALNMKSGKVLIMSFWSISVNNVVYEKWKYSGLNKILSALTPIICVSFKELKIIRNEISTRTVSIHHLLYQLKISSYVISYVIVREPKPWRSIKLFIDDLPNHDCYYLWVFNLKYI